jgi:phenylacetic acid degradation operon negative regulatory protein
MGVSLLYGVGNCWARGSTPVFVLPNAPDLLHYLVNTLAGEISPSPSSSPSIGDTAGVHARSALFDLYGDHVLDRGGWAPIASSVGLLGSLGISAPAVRTAVSRMVREGWLDPVERGARGYAVTTRGRERLSAAHARIYRTGDRRWDGRWHVVVVERQFDRNARSRCAQALGFLGYGQLAADTWIAPRPSPELGAALQAAGVTIWRGFTGSVDTDPGGLAARVWDLDALGEAYQGFTTSATDGADPCTPEEAFVARTELVHAWRLFLFRDPGLPDEVLPSSWPGRAAARRFDERARELMVPAREYVDAWLGAGSTVTSGR